MGKRGPKPLDLKVRIARNLTQEGDCLVWTYSNSKEGYGFIKIAGKTKRVHRVVWELEHGEIPEGMVVRHTCDNPPCAKLLHLVLGTKQDNSTDMIERGRSKKNEDSGKSTLSDADVEEIRRLYAARKHSQRELAAMFGTSQSWVSKLVRHLHRQSA